MRYHDQCNLAICHTVSQPVNFTWQCVIRYHNQCISPGNVLCGTTTSAFHLAMCHAVPRPVQPSNISYGTTTSVFHLAMCYTVPQPVPFTCHCAMRYHDQCNLAICHTVPQPVYFSWQCAMRFFIFLHMDPSQILTELYTYTTLEFVLLCNIY
jgi:hypothetical protein